MDFFSQLGPNTTVLTPNRRLSAAYLKMHHTLQQQQHLTCWPSLDILPFSSWILRLWDEQIAHQIDDYPNLLTPYQEHLCWESILRNSPEKNFILKLKDTAELAKSAWSILKQWGVDVSASDFATSEDSVIFQSWAKQFKILCKAQGWLDQSSVIEILIQSLQKNGLPLPDNIILLGFTELPPLSKAFLDACESQGTKIQRFNNSTPALLQQRIALADEELELTSMAKWARSHHEQNREARIACVIPNLESERDRVIQIFSNVFSDPQTYTLNHLNLPFNISAGKSLASYPVIQTGLKALKSAAQYLTVDILSHMLRTPFIGGSEAELYQRAQYEARLKQTQQLSFSLAVIKQMRYPAPVAWLKRLEDFFALTPDPSAHYLSSYWADAFSTQLVALGWPGERSLNSFEYQVIQAWLTLLAEFARSENMFGLLSRARAIDYLEQLAQQTIFQPQSPEAPIQILGLLEAAELPFDHVWVMGLDDTAWPPAPKPNPFIPQRLQKNLKMPHATAERELAYCEELTAQLKASTQHIVFSHAAKNNEAELRPSPLIRDIPEIDFTQLEQTHYLAPAHIVFSQRDIESFHDDMAPPVQVGEAIRGGTNIFKLQAACAFKAFAELRLHAKKIEDSTLGLNPKDKGIIAHKALEIIWQHLKDQHTLIAYAQDDIKQLIKESVKKAILATLSDAPDSRYLQLEHARLEKILFDWLTLEKKRPAFSVIAQEKELSCTISNIPIQTRVDRIDELADGQKIIIDYKTGKNNSIKSWFGERLDEPQLPLYCMIQTDTTSIAYAQININSLEFKGASQFDLETTGFKKLDAIAFADANEWGTQVQRWKHNIEALGLAFFKGHAEVDPKDNIETCSYCTLKPLCRITEHTL